MKTQEFDNIEWRASLLAIYKDQEFHVASVDFEEKLIGLLSTDPLIDEESGEDIKWVRCENVAAVYKEEERFFEPCKDQLCYIER